MDEVIVRPAGSADFAALRGLQYEADCDHAAHAPDVHRAPNPPRYTAEELAEVVACDNCLLLVAEQGGEVVGFVEASLRLPSEPYEPERPWCGVNNLAVRPDRQRQGIGTALMQAAEAWARDKGIKHMRLDVFDFNTAAKRLYERRGFRPVWQHVLKRLVEEAQVPAGSTQGSAPETRQVRFAVLADLEMVLRQNYIVRMAGTEAIRRLVERQQVVIAERDAKAEGYAVYDYLGVVHPFLAMIWIFEEYRRQGAGAALLRFLEDYLRERGHDALYSSSQADEAPPQAWHRHMGFEECGFVAGLNDGAVGEVLFHKRLR